MTRGSWLMTRVPGRVFRRAERFILRGRFISQRAWNQPRNGINDEHGRKLPATQYEVANGNFFRSQMFRNALVDAFIPSANENDPLQLRVAPRGLLIEQSSPRGHQHDRRLWIAINFLLRVSDALAQKLLHRFEKWLRL